MVCVKSALQVFLSFGHVPSSELRVSTFIYRETVVGDQGHAAYHMATGIRAIRLVGAEQRDREQDPQVSIFFGIGLLLFFHSAHS